MDPFFKTLVNVHVVLFILVVVLVASEFRAVSSAQKLADMATDNYWKSECSKTSVTTPIYELPGVYNE